MPALTATITITTIGTQSAGVPFTVSGTYVLNESTWTDQLIYEDDNGAQIPIASPPVSLGVSSWSYTHAGNLPVGNHTVSVKDPLTGTMVTSNTFAVISGHTIAVNAVSSAVAGQSFAFGGVLGGYASAPTMTYQLTGPTVTAQVTAPTAPAIAAAVGYTQQTYGSPVLGSNLYKFNFYGTDPTTIPAVTNSDGSITYSPGGDSFGAQLSTANTAGTSGSGPYAKTGAFNGIAFGGGAYFQAAMSSSGPFSFWANDVETMNGTSPGVGLGPNQWPGQAGGNGDWIEVDFAEFDSANVYGISIHNWYGTVGSGNVINATTGSPVTPAGSPNYAVRNTYGFLWVPATAGGPPQPPTNIMPNSAGTGAVVGNPGTLPTGWTVQTTGGLSTQVIATGADATTGFPYVQIRAHGTADGSGDWHFDFQFPYSGLVAKPSWNYTQSVWLGISAGSVPFGVSVFAGTDNLDSSQGYISTPAFPPLTVTSTVNQFQTAFASASNAAFFNNYFGLTGLTNGTVVDVTFRIENPQLLQVIQTTQGLGYGKFFFNGVQVGNTVTWTQYNASLPPPPALGNQSAFSVLDTLHLAVIFGTGTANSATVYDLQVWQANANSNISNLPAPAAPAATGVAPTVTGPVTGVTSTSWAMQLTAAQAGTYTVTVSDGSTQSQAATIVVSPVTVNHVITPTTLSAVNAGATFTFAGTLGGYSSSPALTYTINNSVPQAVTGVSATGWSMNLVAPSTPGSYNIAITDGTTSGTVTLTVSAAAKVITPLAPSGVVAGQSFTFTGVLSGYATIPALSYTLVPGSTVTMTGVSITGWAMTATIATAGNYTIAVSDGTVTSQAVAFTVAPANAPTVLRNWYQNPGMDGSFWVQPFQNTANWITSGALITALRGGSPSVNVSPNFAPPWYIGQASDPLVTVTDGTHSIVVHIPLGAIVETPTSQFDQSIGGADATQPYLVWSISGATINTGSVQASGSVITGTYGFAVQDGSGLIMVDAVTGAPGDNNSIGNIQDYELSQLAANPNYVIQHMIAFQLDIGQANSAGPIWPLKVIDGGATFTGTIPQGTTVGIPANVARPAGQTRGFYAWWDVFQQFGGFNYNFGATGGINVVINSFSGAFPSLVNQMVAAWPTVAQQLCVLNYNSGVSGAQYSLATTKGAIPGSTNAFPPPPPIDLSPTGGKNVAPSTFGAWYPSGYNVTPTNSTTGASFIISPNTPVNVVAGTPFTFSGVLSGYAAAPTLTYSINGANALPLTGVTSTGWFAILTISAVGSTTIVVTDAVDVSSGSVSFTANSTVPTANPVTWNPSDINTMTLSNGNYVATATGSTTPYAVPQGVRATTALSSSQILLWEVTFTAITQNVAVGVASAAYTLSLHSGLGGDANGIGAYPSTGTGSQPAQTVYYNTAQLTAGNGVASSVPVTVTLAVNGTNLYFSDASMRSTSGVQWNNSTTADPVANVGGLSFSGIGSPYFPIFTTGEGGSVATLNDGTTAFSAFASNYIAANPSVATLSGQQSTAPARAIIPNVPAGAVVGATFTFAGSLTGYGTAPTLTYALNGAAPVALTGVTSTGWSSTLVSQVSGSNTIVVSDGTINNQVSFTVSTQSGGGSNQIAAPLTGSVTTGTWITAKQNLANSPSGQGYMQYNVLPPAQYNPAFVYPVLNVAHPDNDGMNGSSYPRGGSTFITGTAYINGTQSLDSLFNNVAFRTAFPCFVVACQCDQTLGDTNANGNFGGYNDSQNSGWNENAVNAVLNTVIGNYSIDPGRRYTIGYSLGAIGSLAWLVDNNQYNGPGLKLWTAGAGFSDQLFRPATANSAVFSRMSSVPYFAVSTTSDNVPTSYDTPAWQTYAGNSNYPSLSAYTSGGMAAVRAASTQFYYVNNGSGTPDQCLLINALGGIGTAFYTWLFGQSAGGTSGPTITGVSFTPAATVVANSPAGTVAGSLLAGGANGALSGISYAVSPTTNFKVSGTNLQFALGTVAAGTYPLTVTVSATNASNSPQSYTINVLVTSGSSPAGVFKISGGHVLKPDGTVFTGRGVSFWDNQFTGGVTNAACQPLLTLFPGTNIVRLARVSSTFWTPQTYAQQINWLTAKGIVVVIENHQESNGATGGGGQGQVYSGSLLSQEQAWYSALASFFTNNTYVWFGTCNEPPIDPSLSALWQWQQTTYNTIRATGSNAIVEIEQYNPYLQGSNSGLANTIFSTMHNIVYGPHYYSWIWGGNGSTVVPTATMVSSAIGSPNAQYGGIAQQVQTLQTLTSQDGIVPCGCFEYGPSTTGTGVDASGMNLVNAVNQAVNAGSIFCCMAWLWGNIGDDNLQNASGGVSSPYGATVAAAIAVQAPPPAPAVAAAVGYNTMTFGPNIVVGSTPNSASYPTQLARVSGSGATYPFTFYGTSWKDIGFTKNSDGSVTLDGSGEGENGYGLTTAALNGTTTGNRLSFTGIGFGGGFFAQVVMKGNGPMAFWSNDVETMNGVSIFPAAGLNPWPGHSGWFNWFEGDFAEFDLNSGPGGVGEAYGVGTHNWYNNGGSNLDKGTNFTKVVPSPFPNYNTYNTYAVLWVPATATTQGYLNTYFSPGVGGALTQCTHLSWDQFNSANSPPPFDATTNYNQNVTWPTVQNGGGPGTTAFSILDQLHLALIISGYPGFTTQFQSLQVWQASTAGNIYGAGA